MTMPNPVRFDRLPPVSISSMLALTCYSILWPILMPDVGNDYIPWLAHLATNGIPATFANPPGNYSPPYWYLLALVAPLYGILPAITLIKLVSLVGTLALAWSVYVLLSGRQVAHPLRWAAIVLALPTTILNTALLGQSDALWAAPCVMALHCALGRRHLAMLAWCGIALAVKFQAILFAPFIIALLLNRRVPLHHWLVMPAAYIACQVPAALLGWPLDNLATVYVKQAEWTPLLSLNAPNVWSVAQVMLSDGGMSLKGLALAMAIGCSAFYMAHFSVRMPAGDRMPTAALLCLLITAGLLPHMHERYFFLADIVALIAAALSRERRAIVIALLVQTGSTLALCAYIGDQYWLVELGFGAMAAATVLVIGPLLKPAANDNPLLARTA